MGYKSEKLEKLLVSASAVLLCALVFASVTVPAVALEPTETLASAENSTPPPVGRRV